MTAAPTQRETRRSGIPLAVLGLVGFGMCALRLGPGARATQGVPDGNCS